MEALRTYLDASSTISALMMAREVKAPMMKRVVMVPKTPKKALVSPQLLPSHLLLRRVKQAPRMTKMKQGPSRKLWRGKRRRR